MSLLVRRLFSNLRLDSWLTNLLILDRFHSIFLNKLYSYIILYTRFFIYVYNTRPFFLTSIHFLIQMIWEAWSLEMGSYVVYQGFLQVWEIQFLKSVDDLCVATIIAIRVYIWLQYKLHRDMAQW